MTHRALLATRLFAALLLSVALSAAAAVAQAPNDDDRDELLPGKRMVRAVQYPLDIKIEFDLFSTGRLDGVAGSAEVRRRKSGIEVEVDLNDAPPASQLGGEYRGYVAWALTPAGKFHNLGSFEGTGKVRTTTKVPSFGIIISAERDLNATAPSVPILESGYPDAKRRFYPMRRVYYTPGVPDPASSRR